MIKIIIDTRQDRFYRIKDLPTEERIVFAWWLVGRTRPTIPNVPENKQDAYFLSDYHDWQQSIDEPMPNTEDWTKAIKILLGSSMLPLNHKINSISTLSAIGEIFHIKLIDVVKKIIEWDENIQKDTTIEQLEEDK